MAKDKPEKKKKEIYTSLDAMQKDINKEYGAGSIMRGGSIVPVDVFPTNVAAIDMALGCGGLPQGRIIEIFGHESSGKTTTCLQFIAACQQFFFEKKKRKGVAAFIDVEHAFDPAWATKCGVDVPALLFSQPNSGEEAINIADKMTSSGLVDLIIIDSVAALVPQAELDGEITDHHVGAQARLLSKACRVLHGPANDTNTTIVFINQIRQKIGVMFGSPDTTPGGLALKFYSSVRGQVFKGSAVKDGDTVTGFRPTLKIIKNKCAPPFTEAEFTICVGTPKLPVFGIDTIGSLIEVGADMKVIEIKGSSYSFGEQRLGQGLAKASACVRESPEIQTALKEKIYGSFKKAPVVEQTADDGEPIDELADELLDQVIDGDD